MSTTIRKGGIVPNIGTVLKEEVRRLAKKEIKSATRSTKQLVAQHRREIASLKRIVRAQQREIRFLKAQESKRLNQPVTAEEPAEGQRFSARSVRSQRRRLGLSAEQFAKLLGVSGLTVYHWEHGKARPRKQRLAALFALRNIGRREAVRKLELLKAPQKTRRRAKRRR